MSDFIVILASAFMSALLLMSVYAFIESGGMRVRPEVSVCSG